jgi:uncharacterized protein (UPF0333 family)
VNVLAHEKLKSLIVMVAVFACVGAISWVVVNSHAHSEVSPQEQARDAATAYIRANHSETEQFTENLAWTGGSENTGLLGAETYTYLSQGWNVTIHYPVVANPVYNITADYSAASTSANASIPYRITWQGTWENGCITETSYNFAQ